MKLRLTLSALCLGLVACGMSSSTTALSAGVGGTVFDVTRDAFSLPQPGLSEEHRVQFFVGNSFFNQNWVAAPASVEARDGLGPLFNARSCSGCHFKDGRGKPPGPGEAPLSMLLRVSVPGKTEHGAPLGHTVYGDQLQGNAISGLEPEVDVRVEWDETHGAFASGETYSLRKPRYVFSKWAYGDPEGKLRVSARVAPALIGLGLLEAVPERELERLEDLDDVDADGVAGIRNEVWDDERGEKRLGRFGWKAEQPSVSQQVAGALQGDMGITSSPRPSENHTAMQGACAQAPSGGAPEIADDVFRSVLLYTLSLGVPARRNPGAVVWGQRLFEDAGCAKCHVESLRTERLADLPELGGQVIHPYTDLLLHDLGEGLSDERPSFDATGRQWRTAPLWGIGLVELVNGHTSLLHDGRARNVSEAILWHDGEGRSSRDAFVRMRRPEREALLAFIASL